MYERIDNLRMTDIEASELYPDNYIAMRMDDRVSQIGTVLFIGDDERELFRLVLSLDNPMYCGVYEGLNLRRNCLGGVVVGA
jgi:hypothetical protein